MTLLDTSLMLILLSLSVRELYCIPQKLDSYGVFSNNLMLLRSAVRLVILS